MKFTPSQWGTYQLDDAGGIAPIDDDPRRSCIGRGWVSAAIDQSSRILGPVVRRGWLCGDKGDKRHDESFAELSWNRANALVAEEITRIREEYGHGAIFGGSYGWANAGQFHHVQSQLRRFLNLAGGYVSSRNT